MHKNTTHGMSHKPFYNVWTSILARTKNPKNIGWKNYGGRGIKNEWKSFGEFSSDMYESYLRHSKNFPGIRNTQLDRINNNGNYSKKNCRWTTAQENSNNRRGNLLITYKGKTLTIAGWARELGIKNDSLWHSLKYQQKNI